MKHPTEAWVAACIVSRGGSRGQCYVEECESKVRRWVKKNEVGAVISNVGATLHSMTDDLVQLDEVNEASVIALVRRRFLADRYYTSVGDILVGPVKVDSDAL